MPKYRVTVRNIRWATDGELERMLPAHAIRTITAEDENAALDAIEEDLSDTYGYFIEGYEEHVTLIEKE